MAAGNFSPCILIETVKLDDDSVVFVVIAYLDALDDALAILFEKTFKGTIPFQINDDPVRFRKQKVPDYGVIRIEHDALLLR